MSKDDEDEKKVTVVRNATDLQRLKLEKLMKNPEKLAFIPDRPRDKKFSDPAEFVRNVMGSSAGAGSGEFHVYRHIRRREYSREEFLAKMKDKEDQDDAFQIKMMENKRIFEEKTAKKRQKRLRQKEKEKAKKQKFKEMKKDEIPLPSKASSSSSSEEDEDEDMEAIKEKTNSEIDDFLVANIKSSVAEKITDTGAQKITNKMLVENKNSDFSEKKIDSNIENVLINLSHLANIARKGESHIASMPVGGVVVFNTEKLCNLDHSGISLISKELVSAQEIKPLPNHDQCSEISKPTSNENIIKINEDTCLNLEKNTEDTCDLSSNKK